jgi:uncharacterized protein YaeQ
MAQAPTLYHFDLALNHTDRGISQQLSLRTARHPSETLARVWLRVLAYCWHWQERISFGPGLSDPDAPDLLALDLRGNTELWLRVGKAEPAKIQRAIDQNAQAKVGVFFESPDKLAAFVEAGRKDACQRLVSAELTAVDPALIAALSQTDDRRSKASITIAGDHFYIECAGENRDGAAERVTFTL